MPSTSAATIAFAVRCALSEGRPSLLKISATNISNSSVRIPLVRVPVGLLRIMRAVVHLNHHRFLVRDRRAVHVAFRVAIEAPWCQYHTGFGVLVLSFEAEHELVRGMRVRRRNPGALLELDERDRGLGGVIAPQHFLVHAFERFRAPR